MPAHAPVRPICRHTLPPTVRRQVIALNVIVLAAKVTELVLVMRARHRVARTVNKLAASIAATEKESI